jgi:hypothetical protein
VSELERALQRLGDELAFPDAPDVVESVLGRLAGPQGRRLPARRRALVLAFAVLAVAVGAAMAVPAARTAILEFFGLRGATVQRVETLPAVPTSPSAAILDLGEALPLDDGRPRVKMPDVVLPGALGPPDAAYVKREPYGARLTLVYEPGDGIPRSPYTGVGLLVTEFRGSIDEMLLQKLTDAGTRVERLRVGPDEAIWLEGGPHFVIFRGADGNPAEDEGRLAGNTLLVDRGDILVRIEGDIDRERAVAIAKSLEPG